MKRGIRKAVMAILMNDENKVLIGSSPRDGGYKFPQGGLTPNEPVVTGIKRELKEELDLEIVESDIIQVFTEKVRYFYPPEDPYFIYEGQELSVIQIKYNAKMNLVPQDDEFDKLYWIAPKDLYKYSTHFRQKAYVRALQLCKLL